MLKEIFLDLLARYVNNDSLTHDLWIEIEKNYTDQKRHYHTLQHLENLLNQLTKVKTELFHWETMLFTLYYHDIIYNPLKSDNEEKSAEFAERRMKQVSVPQETIKRCKAQILATKTHIESADSDTNYFTDADLSVLGETWDVYTHYYEGVRKEYSIYPDSIYNPGRKKVLNHFLNMNRIFKTDFFHQKFEQLAKLNLIKEIQLIDKSGSLKF